MAITILITSGPTREYIDPVRFISNASSGKMGKALAVEALQQDCNVIVVVASTTTRLEPGAVPLQPDNHCRGSAAD